MKCLTDCLKGEAKDVVAGVAKTVENYEAIRTILEQEYGDKQKLLTTYMDELQRLEPVKEASSMKPTLNQCHSIWRNMETLKGKVVELDQASFTYQVIPKFPREISRGTIREIRKSHPDRLFMPKELIDALEVVINDEVLEVAYTHRVMKTPATEKREVMTSVLRGGTQGPSREQTRQGRDESSKNNSRVHPQKRELAERRPYCVFCERSGHHSEDCFTYWSWQARKDKLFANNRCLRCLRTGHARRDCRCPAPTCSRCRGKGHQAALCDHKEALRREERPKCEEPKRKKQRLDKGEYVFLKTFCCVAGNKDERDLRLEIRGLLDPGSYRSFLLQRVTSVLRLATTNTTQLSCSSFLQGKAQSVRVDEVVVSLRNQNDYIRTFHLYVTPCITGEICTAPSPNRVQQILPSHLTYADPDLFVTNR